jgi:ornithine cyclodeaminase/alanine dehydrogenase-like protein (mu-crystallin family)
MIGAGRLARGLIEAHMSVRAIDRVMLWSRTSCARERRRCDNERGRIAGAGVR